MKALACTAVIASLWLCFATSAAAQPSEADVAAAEVLFEEGMQLMRDGNDQLACRKLDESLRLAPGPGTRFNLATCYERIGKLATAWAHYLQVEAEMQRAGQTERQTAARRRAESLRPRLSYLRVDVTVPHRGLEVTRDGEALRSGQIGTNVPVDSGSHTITASADGYRTWDIRIDVVGEGKRLTVRVPELEPVPATAPLPEQSPLSTQSIAGIVIGAAGLAAVGIGIGFGVHAISLREDAEPHCPVTNQCRDEGLELIDRARTAGDVATATLALGGVLIAGGLVLFLTAPDDEPAPVALTVGPTGAAFVAFW